MYNTEEVKNPRDWLSQNWSPWIIRWTSSLLKYSRGQITVLYFLISIILPFGVTLFFGSFFQPPIQTLSRIIIFLSWSSLSFWSVLGAVLSVFIADILAKQLCIIFKNAKWIFKSEEDFFQAQDDFSQVFDKSSKFWIGSWVIIGWPFLAVSTHFAWAEPWKSLPLVPKIYLLIFYFFVVGPILHSGIVWGFSLALFLYRGKKYLQGLRFLPHASDSMSGLKPIMNSLLMLASLWLSVSIITWPVLFSSFPEFVSEALIIRWMIRGYVILVLSSQLLAAAGFLSPVIALRNWIKGSKKLLLTHYQEELDTLWNSNNFQVAILILKFDRVAKVKSFPLSSTIITIISFTATVASSLISALP